jgi:hypothetical protein
VFFDTLFRPFMAAMRALVIVLKFFNVDNYWWAFMNDVRWGDSVNSASSCSVCYTQTLSFGRLCSSSSVNKLLAPKLNVESSSTSRAGSKELQLANSDAYLDADPS